MSRTDHSRMPGTNRAWAREDRYAEDWQGELAPRRVKAVLPKRVAITQALADLSESDLTPARENVDPYWRLIWEDDRTTIENFRLIEDLRTYEPADESGHRNYLDLADWERELLGLDIRLVGGHAWTPTV